MLTQKWTQLLTKTGCGCTDWAVTEGKVPGLGLQEESWHGMLWIFIKVPMHSQLKRSLCSSTSHEVVKYGTVTPEICLGMAVQELHVPAAWLQCHCPIHAAHRGHRGCLSPAPTCQPSHPVTRGGTSSNSKYSTDGAVFFLRLKIPSTLLEEGMTHKLFKLQKATIIFFMCSLHWISLKTA